MSCPKSKNQSYLQKNNGKNEVGQPDTPKRKNYKLKDPPGPSSKRSKNDVIKRNATAKEIGKNIRSSSNEKRYSDKSKATKGKKLPSEVGKATGTFKYFDDIEQNGDEIGGTHEEMRVAPSETHHGDYGDGENEAQDQNEQKFTDEQKELVVVLVEKYPALWDMCSQFYHHGDVQKNCWKAISKDSGFTIEQCKRMWRSAKDGVSSRKNKVKAKSGDPATDPADEIDDSPSRNLDQENEECGWLLWEPMKFFRERKGSVITRSSMPSNKGKVRQTSFDTPTNSGDFSNTFDQEDAREIEIGVELGGSPRNSIYNYADKPKPDNYVARMTGAIESLVHMRSNKIGSQSVRETGQPLLKYHYRLASIDELLQKIPQEVVDDLLQDFSSAVYAKVKENRQTNLHRTNNSENATSYVVPFDKY